VDAANVAQSETLNLEHFNEASIFTLLASRMEKRIIYTSLGNSLISINPYDALVTSWSRCRGACFV
jgi:myosin heavy subunit